MKFRSTALLLVTVMLLTANCKNKNGAGKVSFDNYKIADGFKIELAASEPFIQAPVGLDFDNQGRMWIAEMRGFMPNLAGTGDDAPNGRISILEDKDKDGYAESYKLFLDSLVLPRSLSLVYGGVLYTAPPYLWFVEIENDKPGNKTLVDSTYAEGGSQESQANGLMMNIDNWIYSANSQYRYQLRNGKWIKEPTSFRGQFGISKDDIGRLYYNYNTIQIAGDYVLPNTLIGNPYYKPTSAINKVLTRNHRVYPLHATTVNRGYVEGVLDNDSLLLNVTAACGPLIYRGGQFPEEYNQNAFVCEPQANIIKRNILSFKGDTVTATQAWEDREFLSSTDEGFRPVNLFNGPDGALYVVDMHRGVLQYRAFATTYYNERIARKKLDTLVSAGRILRIVSKDKKHGEIPKLANSSRNELLGLLESKNGWFRDRAQQMLINQNDKSLVPELEKLLKQKKDPVAAIHALYVIEGLQGLSFELLQKAAGAGDAMLAAHCLSLLEKFAQQTNVDSMSALAKVLLQKNNPVSNLYLAASLAQWVRLSPDTFLPVLAEISRRYPDRPIYQEAIISSLPGFEKQFSETFAKTNEQQNAGMIASLLTLAVKNRQEGKMNSIFVEARTPVDSRTNGMTIFRRNCASCHGADGDGVEHVGPPLKGSEYVSGPTKRLAMIILNGLEGPIHVNGQRYVFNNTMPAFADHFTDKQISDIIRYLHNAYATAPVKPITPEEIKKLKSNRTGTLTEKQLLELAEPEKAP